MRRIAIVTKIRPGKLEEYKKLHDEIQPDVAETVKQANIRNYSIFSLDGYLFSYFEYIGNDYAADMEKKNKIPLIREWQEATGKCLEPVISSGADTDGGTRAIEVFHNDFK